MTFLRATDLQFHARLGAGQFGVVLLADDQLHGSVAVKVMARAPAESDASWASRRDGLLGEAERLKAAEHANVVRVFDVRQSDDGSAVLLVMEHCAGGSTAELYRQGPVPIDQVQRILLDTSLGLKAVHARGMIHRDIKPGNILLTDSGQAKVGDFGLVTDQILHGYAAAAGYLDHLAMEFHSTRRTSVRTDAWAFGMTAYRLLHGQAFYELQPRPKDAVPAGGFASGLRWLPHVPQRWRRCINRMLHDDPSCRLSDADDIFGALSGLPNSPAWTCYYSDVEVRWVRVVGDRQTTVTWSRPSPRGHTWESRSNPVSGRGRSRRLAGAERKLGSRQAERELEAYFSRTP